MSIRRNPRKFRKNLTEKSEFFPAFTIPILSLLSVAFLSAHENIQQRVSSHILIGDYGRAVSDARRAFQFDPQSEKYLKAYIRALAEGGEAQEGLKCWKKLQKEKTQEIDLLESLAWGILQESHESVQIDINHASMIGAFYTRDVRAVKILLTQLRSSNGFMRAMAVKLASQYRDEILLEEIVRLLKEEKVWYVRLEVLKACGQLNIRETAPLLREIIADERAEIEEKAIALQSLAMMYESLSQEELEHLIRSKRAGLRELLCHIISHLDLYEQAKMIEPFLTDHSSDVRISALMTYGLLGVRHFQDEILRQKILNTLEDHHPHVSITAAWVCLQIDTPRALAKLASWAESEDAQVRSAAASAIAKGGAFTSTLACQIMRKNPDPFVRINLAQGLLGQDVNLKEAMDVIAQFLQDEEQKLMWDMGDNPHFSFIHSSRVRHIPQVPQYPLVIDQMTRLELLHLLAIKQYPKAEQAIIAFLKKPLFGIVYAASSMLLQEGGNQAMKILQELLDHDDEMIRLQSAMVLALSGEDEKALDVLEAAYKNADRELKINIIGAIGHLGVKRSVPFLVERLQEPFQVLRLVAASSLIQCLDH